MLVLCRASAEVSQAWRLLVVRVSMRLRTGVSVLGHWRAQKFIVNEVRKIAVKVASVELLAAFAAPAQECSDAVSHVVCSS